MALPRPRVHLPRVTMDTLDPRVLGPQPAPQAQVVGRYRVAQVGYVRNVSRGEHGDSIGLALSARLNQYMQKCEFQCVGGFHLLHCALSTECWHCSQYVYLTCPSLLSPKLSHVLQIREVLPQAVFAMLVTVVQLWLRQRATQAHAL